MTELRQCNAYIAESGDEGWREIGRRAHGAKDASPEWLIMAAVIGPAETDATNMRVIDDLHPTTKRSQSRKPLEWRSLENDHYKKRLVADTLGRQQGLLYCAVAVWKPALAVEAPGLRKQGYLYHLTGRYLIERLSWVAWEQRGSYRRQVNLNFESRQQTSSVDLERYVRNIEADPGALIPAGSIGNVRPVKPSSKGIQVADLVAGAVQDALEPNHRGDIEPDYLQRLKKRLYCKPRENRLSYGLKIFPPEALDVPRYSWLRDF